MNAAFFATWLGLTSKLVRKYLSRSKKIEIGKGHLRAIRKNIRSIKSVEL